MNDELEGANLHARQSGGLRTEPPHIFCQPVNVQLLDIEPLYARIAGLEPVGLPPHEAPRLPLDHPISEQTLLTSSASRSTSNCSISNHCMRGSPGLNQLACRRTKRRVSRLIIRPASSRSHSPRRYIPICL